MSPRILICQTLLHSKSDFPKIKILESNQFVLDYLAICALSLNSIGRESESHGEVILDPAVHIEPSPFATRWGSAVLCSLGSFTLQFMMMMMRMRMLIRVHLMMVQKIHEKEVFKGVCVQGWDGGGGL